MNLIRSGFCFFFFLFLFSFGGFSQSNRVFDPLMDDINEKLPRLSVLIDSAINHDPYLKFRNKELLANQFKLNSYKIDWTKNIGLIADFRYGTFDYITTNSSDNSVQTALNTSRSQTQWGAGAYIKFPVFDAINRRNQINIGKSEMDQAKNLAEVQIEELRQKVIRQYNDLVLKQRLLRIAAKYAATTRINMDMADKEFVNGVITVADYSRTAEITARAESEFETVRMDFQTSYMILEEIVGMKFNLSNDINRINENH